MVSFLKRLFGSGTGDAAGAKEGAAVDYEGFKIIPAPEPDGGQWRLAGKIVKPAADGDLERIFIRADLFPSREDAETYAVSKAKQIIDFQGERLFADGEKTGRA